MFEQFKGKSSGVKDYHGKEICEGNTVRWMGEDGECYQGTVEFGEPTSDESPFLSGFLILHPHNITEDVLSEDGELKDNWTGEMEVIHIG